MAEFVKEIYCDDYEVWDGFSWKSFHGIGKTIPYQEWIINTENSLELICADDHLIQTRDGIKKTKDITHRDYILTDSGYSRVISISETTNSSHMYDLLDVEGSLYLTDGIVSHNSTTIGTYVLWYACFNEDKFIGIVSNKADSAKEILHRIKLMYEELPYWIKPGVIEWNKTSIEFENGTRIQVSATSDAAFRGRSINLLICVTGDNVVQIRNKVTGIIEEITMEELTSRLTEETPSI